MNIRIALTLAVFALAPAPAALAGGGHGGGEPMSQIAWSFEGSLFEKEFYFGTYDRGALQRGYKIYREVCAGCHSMKRVYFRNLSDLGYSESQIKNIAKEYTYMDGPNEEGEMVERPGLPSDHFKSPFANDNAAKFANGGALPPDLSLIIKARPDGANYVYNLLTGYTTAPHGEQLATGQYWNKYFPGHKIGMAPPLSDGAITYEDGSAQTLDQYSKDVVQFLAWAAEPNLEARKATGFKVLIFLAVFAAVMYAVKRRVWADQH